MKKIYNLTQCPNESIKDTAPKWMDDFFKNSNKKKVKENPFKGVDNFLNIGLEKNNK